MRDVQIRTGSAIQFFDTAMIRYSYLINIQLETEKVKRSSFVEIVCFFLLPK